ncbi:ROK family transcriptional regulator [Actinacidiphila epipremni]|uniref:ROK family transcriptional regulator n=1 Tax=Actinacidiphila epipremni TaxID=2053013 RepID=A0ABX0ZSK6_9ACTN|nr:ROK family transcriptional regulator [Actinacidiphila epipremni]NJP44744.1 ROK family transcriptional regulator [Actinacidiphila epipremni]
MPPATDRPPGQGPQAEVRQHNLGQVLRRVHLGGAVARAELTRLTGLNRSTTGALVAALAEAGLVREETPRSHRAAGRPSPLVLPVPARAQALALEVGVERIRIERVGLGGEVLERRTLPGAGEPMTFDATVDRIAALVTSVATPALGAAEPAPVRPGADEPVRPEADPPVRAGAAPPVRPEVDPPVRPGADAPAPPPGPEGAPAHPAPITGIGVAVPGLVRRADGLVRYAPNLDWTDAPFARALSARLPAPLDRLEIAVGNDADLGALGEYSRGAARGCRDFVYLSANVGVGGGLFCGGRPVPGQGGYAGEIGHMTVNPDGRRCRCGARGCWETEIGTDVIIEAAGLPVPYDHALTGVVEAAEAGDERAARALDDAARWLAIGLGNLAVVLSPRLVVFGGGLQDIHDATAERIAHYGASTGLARARAPYVLRRSALGYRAPLVGAAERAFAPLLDDPLGRTPAPAPSHNHRRTSTP